MKIYFKKIMQSYLLIMLVMLVSWQFPFKTIGQCLPISQVWNQFCLGNPNNPEQQLIAQRSIQNTGCDIQAFSLGGTMGVAVCDGNIPKFTWKLSGSASSYAAIAGTGGGTITDPDIVLTHDGQNAIIVYIQDGHCYYESWKWNTSLLTFQLNQSATLLSTALNTCTNPNIDIGYSSNNGINYIVATWDEYMMIGSVYTVRGSVGFYNSSTNNFVFGPKVSITSSTNSYQPDVCINTDFSSGASTSLNYVTFTYIQGSLTGTHSLCYRGDTWDDLYNNAGAGLNVQVTLKSAIYPTFGLSRPRISANLGNNGLTLTNQKDFEIVVENLSDGGYKILGFNLDQGVQNPEVVITGSPNISNVNNGYPVVACMTDVIIVSWVYGGVINGGTPNEILSRQICKISGCTIGTVAPNNTTFYSVVNNNLQSNQHAPSIAGKNGLGNTLYVWHDAGSGAFSISTLQYKISLSLNTSLKLVNTDELENGELNFYPNPASTCVILDFGKNETWIGSQAVIMNMEGQTVKKFTIENLSTSFEVSNLKEGLYFIKVINSDQMVLKKVVISH